MWFRDSCRREADRLGVAGWARNLDDGSVEVVAVGADEAVAELEAWCRIGPPRALVTSVDAREAHEADVGVGVDGFRIR